MSRALPPSRHHALPFAGILTAAILLTSIAANSASVEPAELLQLRTEAAGKGFVPVMISLEAVPLNTLKEERADTGRRMEQKALALRQELGRSALRGGYWSNGAGQIGLYVDQTGLQLLAESRNAVRFGPDVTRSLRETVHGEDGGLAAIERALQGGTSVLVEVFLASEEARYDIDDDGRTRYLPSPGVAAEVGGLVDRLLRAHVGGMRDVDRSPLWMSRPSVITSLDRETFYALRLDPDVRAIRPIGHVDVRAPVWDSEVLDAAARNGNAEVVVTLRGGATFTPRTGYLREKEKSAQASANQRALDSIFERAKVKPTVLRSFADVGAVHVRLTASELQQLYASADARVLTIALNKARGGPALTNSTLLLNMPAAWSLGYTAPGQYIVVADTGILKSHAMLQMNGITKVSHEGCYGTTSGSYQTMCPAAGAGGDSPFNTPNSGEPFTGSLTYDRCYTTGLYWDCLHGTHVAGIAAGRASASVNPSNLQGVAIGAQIVSLKVFSAPTSSGGLSWFNADLLAALTDTYFLGTTAGSNPLVVNLSLDGSTYSSDCGNVDASITNRVQDLISRTVPVIAASGNGGSRTGVAFPACVPNVIKVGSVQNDASGTTLTSSSNIGAPSSFSGPILLSPGSLIKSASAYGATSTYSGGGTSQAAPHVAGLYAAYKAAVPGTSVADATAWVVGAGVPVTVGNHTYRRVRYQ